MSQPFAARVPFRARGPFRVSSPFAAKSPWGMNEPGGWAIDATGAQIRAAMSDVTAYADGGWRIPGTAGARLNASARSSAAMQQKSDGAYEYAAHNLLTQSENYAVAGWTKSAISVEAALAGPRQARTASRLVAAATSAQHDIGSPTVAVSSGAVYNCAIYARAAEASVLQITLGGSASHGYANFNLSTGVVSSSGNSPVTTTIESVGGGWYRCAVGVTALINGNAQVFFGPAASATATRRQSYTGDGTSGLEVFGAQLNLGPATTAYVPTITAAVYGPAIDYVSSVGAYGLRSEPAATNLLTNSGMAGASAGVSPTGWLLFSSSSDCTISVAGSGVEYGLPYLDISVSGTASGSYVDCAPIAGGNTPAASASQQLTASMYTRVVSGSLGGGAIRLLMIDEDSGGNFLRQNGSVSTSATAFTRSSVTVTTGASTAQVRAAIGINNVSGVTLSVTVRLYCTQVETGSVATSPILTYGASATRAADAVVVPDTSPGWIGQSAGTVVVEYVPQAASSATIVALNDTTANEQIVLGNDGVLTVTDGGAAQATPDAGTPNVAARNRMAAAYAANDFAVSLNGGAVAADTSGTLPTTTQIAADALNGHITRIRYVGRRLDDGKLVGLTA